MSAGFRYTPAGGSTKTHVLTKPMAFEPAPSHVKNRWVSESMDGSAREVVSVGPGRAQIDATIRFSRSNQDLLHMLEYAADGLAVSYYPDLAVNTSYALWLVDVGETVSMEPQAGRWSLGDMEIRVRFRDASASGTSLEALFSPWLFRYEAGMAAPGAVFTRTGTARQIGQFGVLESVATGLPRDGHWPLVDGVRTPSLLLEGARTNSWTYSEQLDNAAWTKTRSSITANATTAPDGTATMDKLVEDASASTTHFLSRGIPAVTDNTSQAMSFFAKAAERTWVAVVTTTKAGNSPASYVNLATGEVGTVHASHAIQVTQQAHDSWRVEVTYNVQSGATTPAAAVYLADADNSRSYSGDGSSGLFLWGMQFEADAVAASSYIPTTTAAATRNAETFYAPYTHAPQEMTVYVKFVERGSNLITNAGIVHIGGTSPGGDPRLQVHAIGAGGYSFRYDDGTVTAAASAASPSHGSVVEIVGQVTTAGVSIYQSIGGATATSATQAAAFTFPSAFNASRAYIGSRGTAEYGLAEVLSVKIASGTKTLAEMRAL